MSGTPSTQGRHHHYVSGRHSQPLKRRDRPHRRDEVCTRPPGWREAGAARDARPGDDSPRSSERPGTPRPPHSTSGLSRESTGCVQILLCDRRRKGFTGGRQVPGHRDRSPPVARQGDGGPLGGSGRSHAAKDELIGQPGDCRVGHGLHAGGRVQSRDDGNGAGGHRTAVRVHDAGPVTGAELALPGPAGRDEPRAAGASVRQTARGVHGRRRAPTSERHPARRRRRRRVSPAPFRTAANDHRRPAAAHPTPGAPGTGRRLRAVHERRPEREGPVAGLSARALVS
ncbi:MAG: hypothetical protein BJ554DRAFT_158 [Olpidium bornovanus]|uniref:Uncharacterized protein n=1 Tax=Olpidium bornovanus TaxID=278681 RepID=A0A8H7ZUI3_9FUNG|nr:MAG: hypothetical protein BJ554DRAFT_158 [Olpidium bornovanus]